MELTGPRLRDRRRRLGLSQAKLAELTGVAQHRLSAFELGKAEFPPALLHSISTAISEEPRVLRLVQRNKRYQDREFAEVPRRPDRVARAGRTTGNVEYLKLLSALAEAAGAPRKSPPAALSLFSGCGGFSLGVAAAGFEVRGFLELDPQLRAMYRANLPRAAELGGDITTVSDRALARARKSLGPIDLLVGGPPCQGFSLAGKRWVDDPRNRLFKRYLRFVEAFRPGAAILENVRLLTSMRTAGGNLIRDEILEEFRLHGYDARLFEINANRYGVPQHRERAFFVAVREDLGLPPSIPPATHGPAGPPSGSRRFRTFADACSDLPYLEAGEESPGDRFHAAVRHPRYVVDWLWDVPEGRSAHENADPAKRPPSGYNTTYKRQVWHEPASTVQTTFGMISGCRNVHPIATRSLTIREAARIQSFPDSFLFQGSRGAIRKGIGNAVPPLLALALASHLRDRLFKGPPSTPAWHHPDARTSARMRRVHRTDTKPELVVRALLSRLGYRYRLHAAALPGRPDIVIPRLRCVVFVHGCFWHRHRCRAGRSFPASNVERWQIKFDLTRRRDRRHREALRRSGWRVLVLWECQLRDQERLTATLLKFLAAER